MIMSIKFLDIAPTLPASIALVYVLSFTNAWDLVLPRRVFQTVNATTVDGQIQPSDEEANRQNSGSLKNRVGTLDIPSYLLYMGHWHLTTGKLFSDKQCSSNDVCLGQIGLVAAELGVYYHCTGHWLQRQLILLAAAWACMIVRSPWPTRHTVFDAMLSLIITATAIRAILPQRRPRADPDPVDLAITKSSSTPLASESGKKSRHLLVHFHIFSAALLLVFLLDGHSILEKLPASPVFQNVCVSVVLLGLRQQVENWRASSQRGQNLYQHVRAYLCRSYTSIPQFVREGFLRPLVGLAPLFIFGALTSFLTSCFGFRYLILGLPCTGPSFRDGGILGAFIYMIVACANLVLRRREIGEDQSLRTRRFNIAVLAAFGQTVTGFAGVAGVLYAIRVLKDWDL